MKATKIAQESRRCLALEPFLVKSRAEFNVHAGLRDFGAKCRIKKSPAQFAHGFAIGYGPTGLKLGAVDICFPV